VRITVEPVGGTRTTPVNPGVLPEGLDAKVLIRFNPKNQVYDCSLISNRMHTPPMELKPLKRPPEDVINSLIFQLNDMAIVHIVRSVVDQVEGEPKTAGSKRPLPVQAVQIMEVGGRSDLQR